MSHCRYTVTIKRWDVYCVSNVVAHSPAEAEEHALELYEEDDRACEHEEGGVESVYAEPEEE